MKNFRSSGRPHQPQRHAGACCQVGGGRPHVVCLPPGDYRWCGCGRADSSPLCDASNVDCSKRGLPFAVTARSGTQWLCGCGRSRQLPFCDGSTHNRGR